MQPEDPNAERLNEALDALLGGTPPAEAAAGLPERFGPLLEAAGRLVRARPAAGPGPRATFVLGLEEQLRTDLRLRPAAGDGRVWRGQVHRWLLGLFAGMAILALFLSAVQRSGPRDPLYPAKRTMEDGRVWLARSAADRAGGYLDLGWRRLGELRALHEAADADAGAATRMRAVLDDLVEAYGAAAREAVAASDQRVGLRVRAETDAASRDLARMADEAGREGLGHAIWFRVSASQLQQRIALQEQGAPGLWPVPDETATEDPTESPTEAPSGAVATATPPPTDRPPTAPPLSPTAPPPASPVPPSATAVVPTPTYEMPTVPAAPPVNTERPPRPPATSPVRPPSTQLPPTPSSTPAPQVTADPPGAADTPTPDRWPATSTPEAPTAVGPGSQVTPDTTPAATPGATDAPGPADPPPGAGPSDPGPAPATPTPVPPGADATPPGGG